MQTQTGMQSPWKEAWKWNTQTLAAALCDLRGRAMDRKRWAHAPPISDRRIQFGGVAATGNWLMRMVFGCPFGDRSRRPLPSFLRRPFLTNMAPVMRR